MSNNLLLTNYNNCGIIRGSGSIVDILASNDYSNINNIVITGSVNNCQVVSHTLSFTDNTITLPEHMNLKTECNSVQRCQTNLIYDNVYDDLKTEINTNVRLSHKINSTTTTLPFCGLTATTTYGSNINYITIQTNTVTLQTSTVYNNGSIDYSSSIKNEIESLLTINGISFNSVIVTYQVATSKPVQSRYQIQINTNTQISGSINTSTNVISFTSITGCTGNVYGFNHKRSTFSVSNFINVNTELIKWYTSQPWDYNSATGVLIESYNDNTFNVIYNTSSDFTIYMVVSTTGTTSTTSQEITYSWTFNSRNQQILNTLATKSAPHYLIVPNGDTSSVIGSVLTGATSSVALGSDCTNYLEIKPSFFNVDTIQSINNTVFPDGVYSINVLITYNDGTPSINCTEGVFLDCVIKCAVADCVYNTKSYELMTLYNSIKALDNCDTHYISEMSEIFKLIVSNLCYDVNTLNTSLNQDCGCS